MKIYSRTGDCGYTSLFDCSKVEKCDDRIELLGSIDELSSHLGLAKVIADDILKAHIIEIQHVLNKIMTHVAASSDSKYILSDETAFLEEKIDFLENEFSRNPQFVLYGGCELSARLDVARAVARRAERQFCKTASAHGLDNNAQKYLNRLSDFLYVYARYADYKNGR